jgi:hypothetical protein
LDLNTLSQLKELAADKDKDSAVPKALAYKEGLHFKPRRPTSAGGNVEGGADPMARVKRPKGPKVEQAFFYTGNKNDVGEFVGFQLAISTP